jgi:hypothetical protein
MHWKAPDAGKLECYFKSGVKMARERRPSTSDYLNNAAPHFRGPSKIGRLLSPGFEWLEKIQNKSC